MHRVLIADDNPDLRIIFARAFDKRYFEVSMAEDGQEALEALQNEIPDVVVLDVDMPRLSGLSVLSYIRQNAQMNDLKVIVVTGNSMASQAPEAALADLFLVKPVSISELVTFAQRLIAMSNSKP
jgi:two-component system, OmpR family, alkaline phosphatase synthesis response regulator PhoP